ncbi:hypothetical protein EDI_156130 [Entamoeba dispar SAW760]|uniref:Uncharacterized protein n=1 Tax=Entamoeba dispar (strain ATCC PRA-260 / SAW760) TaxID=370354 RepID=B0EFD8_ENTDS|nr:uncharacterized protein EDI_156130 [Entamoeba dispar SAW760]EDR26757.1 hypothetical protein EDI_156130 [Entamoeba dispar SAW760]|eukprot:EDR26757.1 hypothetical protein EDI_156130 [Entamoeba dispar SAW760]
MTSLQLQTQLQSVQDVNKSIQLLKQKLSEFEKIDYNTLSSADKIKLNSAMAYSYATLYFSYCKLKDDQTNVRGATKELERIRAALTKTKKTE